MRRILQTTRNYSQISDDLSDEETELLRETKNIHTAPISVPVEPSILNSGKLTATSGAGADDDLFSESPIQQQNSSPFTSVIESKAV